MKFKTVLFLLILMVCSIQTVSAQKRKKKKSKKDAPVELVSHLDSISYAFGIVLGNNLKAEKVFDLNLDILNKAIAEVLIKDENLIDGMDSRNLVNKHIENKRKEAFERNLAESTAFLAENSAREGVISTESGLQYEIIKAADGPKPTLDDKVLAHYHGTLIDGTIFDSSVKRGEPMEFPLKGVIKGWTEVLQLMPAGSKWRIYVPPSLAYGDHAAGPKIGPNMALIFEIEVLKIVE